MKTPNRHFCLLKVCSTVLAAAWRRSLLVNRKHAVYCTTSAVVVCMAVDFELSKTNVVNQTILQHPFSEIAMKEPLDAVARILQQPSNRQIPVFSIEIDLDTHFPIHDLPSFNNLYLWTFVSIYQSTVSWYVPTFKEVAPVYWSSKLLRGW